MTKEEFLALRTTAREREREIEAALDAAGLDGFAMVQLAFDARAAVNAAYWDVAYEDRMAIIGEDTLRTNEVLARTEKYAQKAG